MIMNYEKQKCYECGEEEVRFVEATRLEYVNVMVFTTKCKNCHTFMVYHAKMQFMFMTDKHGDSLED